ncbi:hypothetical protein EU91_0164 [Prochlorococcus marinus str. GP2]|uniref:Uncharacterized protein n=1 Tax=Prochlorococcus marinus str. GP2 TaxID=59925 RepID=A0A0A1ZI33_PROMR|nr:hypothetical protein EU91_0164 [Prochlorococcus marinus str. GP2]
MGIENVVKRIKAISEEIIEGSKIAALSGVIRLFLFGEKFTI